MAETDNIFTKRFRILPSSQEDLRKFKDILHSVVSLSKFEIPSKITGNLEFLLSRNLAELSKMARLECESPLEAADLDNGLQIVIEFLEEFVSATDIVSQSNKSLLREILDAANQGMLVLDAKINSVVSGNDPRYTPEFLRFLSSEISRLSDEIPKNTKKNPSVSEDSEDEDDDANQDSNPDPKTTMTVLAIIQARLSTAMEPMLGEDAWAAALLSRLLQVDQIVLREVALDTALQEMPSDSARAQFFDVVEATFDDVTSLDAQAPPPAAGDTKGAAAAAQRRELAGRLKHLKTITARRLGLRS